MIPLGISGGNQLTMIEEEDFTTAFMDFGGPGTRNRESAEKKKRGGISK